MSYGDYLDYIESPAWKRKRSNKIVEQTKRGKVCCEDCKRSISYRSLQVHHETYARLGSERLTDLSVLCNECHAKRHGKLELFQETPLPELSLSAQRMNNLRNAVLNELERIEATE